MEVRLKKSTGYDPYDRFAAALIASAIHAARKIERPHTHQIHVSALRAIAWLASPAASNRWFDMAGFEYAALVDRLPLERWISQGRELVLSDAALRNAMR